MENKEKKNFKATSFESHTQLNVVHFFDIVFYKYFELRETTRHETKKSFMGLLNFPKISQKTNTLIRESI